MKFEYEIKFSDRRTVGITVTSANKVILRCPENMSAARAEKFLEEKSAWIEKHLQKNSEKSEKYAALTGYKTVLINGAEVPLTIGSKKIEIRTDGVFVRSLKNIQKAYSDSFAENFINRVSEISQKAVFRLNTVKVKNFKARWGSCDAYNNL
ncbi:MAG: M48 family metallopeptidase, partial [Clostridia bacterium]|nr:M48 family metallopeptidase [Clostridia bacterium]